MKDIHSELEADSGATQGETENGHESKTEQAVNSKGHPKLSKKSKFWSGIALFILITVLIGLGLSEFFSPGESIESSSTGVTPPLASSIKVDEDSPVSEEHKENVEAAVEEERKSAIEGDQTHIDSQSFQVEDDVMAGVQIQVPTFVGVDATHEPQEQVVEVSETKQPDYSQFDATSDKTVSSKAASQGEGQVNKSQKQNRMSSERLEARRNAVKSLLTTSEKKQGQAVSWKAPSESRFSFLNEAAEHNAIESEIPGDTDQNEDANPTPDKLQGEGRGLLIGDMLLGEVINGLNSNSPSPYMLVRVLQEPLKGAKIMFEPSLHYDNYLFASKAVTFGHEQSEISAIIVTPNSNLSTGYRSKVNYHELYKLGVIAFHGIMKGGAEYINSLGGSVAINGDTVIQTNEFDSRKLLIASAGGVADTAEGMVAQELDKPPTVEVFSKDIVGIMFVEKFNPPWLPKETIFDEF